MSATLQFDRLMNGRLFDRFEDRVEVSHNTADHSITQGVRKPLGNVQRPICGSGWWPSKKITNDALPLNDTSETSGNAADSNTFSRFSGGESS